MSSASLSRVLMTSKLNPPTSRAAQVPRDRVSEQVLAASAARLVLVRAPAGFGKTTAMTQCMTRMDQAGIETAWLTLDDADNDVSRFIWYLNAAVSRLTREQDDEQAFAASASGSSGDAAFEIVARLAEHESPFALFLDDFERIQDPAALGLVREIIEHLPRRGQFIIGSRTLPELGLGRLRARGQLLEIDATQLRFSVEETTDFLIARRQLALTQEDLLKIHSRTEGWVTALWLASLALEGHSSPDSFIERFSGASQTIADYLAFDVLALQSEPVRQFLLRTSILRHLNVPLCEALLPETDARAMLQHLSSTNTFLTPLENEDTTYRYHSLFSEFLKAQLQIQHPEEIPQLHLAASLWYEKQDRPVPAIDHALEGGDYQRAMRLLQDHAANLLSQGRMRLLSRWFGSLPPEHLKTDERLQMIWIWAVCFTRGPTEALEMLEETGLDHSDNPNIRPHVRAIRPLMLSVMDRQEEAIEAGEKGLPELPTSQPFADMAMINSMASTYSVMGLYDKARQLLDGARDAQGAHASAFNAMYSETVEGIIDMQEGRQRQAAARFRLAVGATRQASSFNQASGNAWAGVLHAGAIYESNQLELAARLLHVYGPLARDVGLPDHMLLGDIMLARIAFSKGDIDQAFRILTELEHLGHIRQLSRVVATTRLERSRLLLFQGRSEAARQELQRAGDPFLWQRVNTLRLPANDLEYLELAEFRWDILAGNPEDALPGIERSLTEANAEHRYRRALKLKLLKAMALQRNAHIREALELMKEVLQAAATEGYVRLIVDEGPAAGTLVVLFSQNMREQNCEITNPILAGFVHTLIEAFGPAVRESASAEELEDTLLDPLTRKEIRVLQLLSEGYSNGAMAEKLFVSDSTVRTHLRNINSKLNASSRTQAVAIARRLGIV
ncbi:LuxR C-terminal-related transcriptional regulator [uncultured Marinobacter sp.]|uniref:LuxR C-terminal-related transcriptional regulator n=1 Tax=uncultured Marinobacter sp. TaxID=187379 RepID=UPI0030DB67B8